MNGIIDFVIHNFVFFGGVVSVIAFVWATFKVAKNNAMEQSNNILRELNKDKDEKIKALENKQTEILEKLDDLEKKFDVLKNKNTDYEDLIIRALKDHFMVHPDMAAELGEAVKRRKLNA